jgi:hypothetical protein
MPDSKSTYWIARVSLVLSTLWQAGALIALVAIASALVSISKHLNAPPPPAALLDSQDEATRAAAGR